MAKKIGDNFFSIPYISENMNKQRNKNDHAKPTESIIATHGPQLFIEMLFIKIYMSTQNSNERYMAITCFISYRLITDREKT